MSQLILFVSVAVFIIALYIANYQNHFASLVGSLFHKKVVAPSLPLFTTVELSLYNGVDKPELYLALLGNVFDVTLGSKHYGPGQSYNFFVGRDASRSFVTGEFTDDKVSDDVINLNYQELRSLNHWVQFYKKQYKKVGHLIGRYYDEKGNPTRYNKQVKKLIKAAEKDQVNQDEEKRKFPPCNVEWDPERGTRVWCTRGSGGIDRDWIGVPRQFYEPGSESYRCACINEDLSLGNLKEYENCAPDAISCYVNMS